MRERIRYLRNGHVETIDLLNPRQTLLDHLRLDKRAVGTKEGCNEGDCGACTVVLGRLREGRIVYEPVNACILPTGMIDGCELVTVEDLALIEKKGDTISLVQASADTPDGSDDATALSRGGVADGEESDPLAEKDKAFPPAAASSGAPLHPVQAAMLAHHGSQCGFCTPGIVMSLFALYQEGKRPVERAAVTDQLAGNLCRCTGYRPIIDAALEVCREEPQDRFALGKNATAAALAILHDDVDIFIGDETRFFAAPASIDSLAALYERHPDATLVAGATDVGLWITKQLRDLPKLIWLGRVVGLDRIVDTPQAVSLGATVTHRAARDILAAIDPDLGEMMRRFGSVQVRASGTVGGSIANASPIGDLAPALIALDSRLYLRKGPDARSMALEDFFQGYGRQDRAPGEFVLSIAVRKLVTGEAFRCYKVSKRFDEDISSVMAAFRFSLEDRTIARARVAYGGMAATPRRGHETEAALAGLSLDDGEGLNQALAALAIDYQPIADLRASAGYRMDVARALLTKAVAEIAGSETRETRIIGLREATHAA